MQAETQKQHRWLQQLVGEWTYESDCNMGPDQPKVKFKGTETVPAGEFSRIVAPARPDFSGWN